MTKPYIRPDVQAYLEMMAANAGMTFTDEVIAQIRLLPADAMAALDLPVGELGEIRDMVMPGPHGDIALRLYDPRKRRGPGPVAVFYHGGGFVVGSIGSHAGIAAEIARQLDLPVVSVEYPLAPEHRWPAAPDDAEAAARWIAANGAALGRDVTSLIVCGDSAGGNLAIVTALALREVPAAAPVLMQIAIYPVADMSRDYPSGAEFGTGYGLDAGNMAYFGDAYRADRHHWRCSPLLADQAGMPPTLVVTAGLDPLRDEGRAYAAATIAAGVATTYREFPATIHGFCSYRKLVPSAQADLTATLDLAKAMIAESSAA